MRGARELQGRGEIEGQQAGGAAQGADEGGAGAGGGRGEEGCGGGVVEGGLDLGGVAADVVIGDVAVPASPAGELGLGRGRARAGAGGAVAGGAPGALGQGSEDGDEAGAGAQKAAGGQGQVLGEAGFVRGDTLEEGEEGETQYECEMGEGVGRLIVRGLSGGDVHGMGKLSHGDGRRKG